MLWGDIFQACCLNFDKTMCKNFGDRLTLTNLFAYALQFSRMDFKQSSILNEHDIPPRIKAIDANLHNGLNKKDMDDMDYRYQTYYTFISTPSKNRAHVKFVSPDSEQGKELSNVLIKPMPADYMYPHKPAVVVKKQANLLL